MENKNQYPNFTQIGILKESGRRIFVDNEYDEYAIEIEEYLKECDRVTLCSKCGAPQEVEFEGVKESIETYLGMASKLDKRSKRNE